jgi:hypothetical protein
MTRPILRKRFSSKAFGGDEPARGVDPRAGAMLNRA